MAAVSAPPSTVDELVASLEEFARDLALRARAQVENARRTTRECPTHHGALYLQGWVRGVASAIALATGEDSETIYNRIREAV